MAINTMTAPRRMSTDEIRALENEAVVGVAMMVMAKPSRFYAGGRSRWTRVERRRDPLMIEVETQ